MNIGEQSSQINIRIAQIEVDEGTSSSFHEKQNQIKELRLSILEQPRQSSLKVVTNLANTMIGSSIIIYPVLFVKDGILGSLLILLVIGAFQYVTCRLLVVHNRPDEVDFTQQIKRILGPKWARFNSMVNFLLIFFVSICYFMLIVENFFSVTSNIVESISPSYQAPKEKINLGTYSLQYASLICIILVIPFLIRREIESLMKFLKYTVYCVVAYMVFVGVALIRVLAEGVLDFSLYEKFDPNFSTVAGTFALSFLIHPVACPILKRNVNQNNNQRDLMLGYMLTAFIYAYVGFIGGLTCAESVEEILSPKTQENYTTLFNCVKRGNSATSLIFFIVGNIVQLGIFFQNLSVMPILSFLTRKELISLMTTEKAKHYAFKIYNVAIVVASFAVTFFNIDVSIVMSLDGAIIGFFMGYAIPIYCHLKCYHIQMNKDQKEARANLLAESEDDEILTQSDDIRVERLKCNEHSKKNKWRHFLVYGFVGLVGVSLGAFKLMSFAN